MNQFWKRTTAAAVLSASIIVSVGGAGVETASAAPPASGFISLQQLGTIQTSPFLLPAGAPPSIQRPGDVEDLAYDPVRKSLWMPDDSKSRLYEVAYNEGALESGTLRNTITVDSFKSVKPFNNPAGPTAGTLNIGDFEAMAYDKVTDTMYAFAGSCCPAAPHDAVVLRLTRNGSTFKVVDYQPLTAPFNDLSGAGVVVKNGTPEIWVGLRHGLYHYHYETNTVDATPVYLPLYKLGYINGVSFSDDNAQVWVTTDNMRIVRVPWPAPTVPVATDPNNGIVTATVTAPVSDQIDPRTLGIPDTRAIALIGSRLAVADGYDNYLDHGIQEFQVHVYDVTNLPPVPSFTATPTTIGSGGTVTFQSTSTRRPTSETWDFGDGSPLVTVTRPDLLDPPVVGAPLPGPYTPPTVTHKYNSPGTFVAKLVATNANPGTPTPFTMPITVTAAPAADFTMSVSSGVAPLSVAFTDASNQGVLPDAWSWNFGDGTPVVTAQNPTHVFNNAGTFTVTLTASKGGLSSSVSKQVSVLGLPTAAFTASPMTGAAPLLVNFVSTSTATPPITQYKWSFGDGTTSFDPVSTSHTFEKGGRFTVTLTVTNANGSKSTSVDVTVAGGSRFVGVNPVRLMDTRAGGSTIDTQAQGEGALGQGGTRSLTVVGRNSIPAAGVGAVALNVTAIGPNAASYLTVWPTGAARPNASNLNFTAGQTIPNMVIVKVGNGGQIDLFNELGRVDIAVDVLGFFPEGPAFNGITPERFMDLRPGGNTVDHQSEGGGPLGASTVNLKIAGRGSVPATGAGSVALNVTVTSPTEESYLTVWPKGQARPNASNLNFTAGTTIPNMVIVPMSSAGEISIFNAAGSVNVIVDVLGWFPSGPTASFIGKTPARVFDNRAGGATIDTVNQGAGALGAGQETTFKILGRGDVPASGVGSVALNVTVTGPTAESYLTVWPGGTTRPNASNLNFTAGTTIPNMVIVPVGPKGEIALFNALGSTNIIVDVLGYFPA